MLVNFLLGGGGGGSGRSTEKRGKKTFGILHEICVFCNDEETDLSHRFISLYVTSRPVAQEIQKAPTL